MLDRICAALEQRHQHDLFAYEANCGPGGSLRLDAWAAARSWAHADTHGYEIKISRADWRQDSKVERYREYVHRLWIVCPWGLIAPEEVGEIGLLWLTAGEVPRLITKRTAPRYAAPRSHEVVWSLLINRGSLQRTGGVAREELSSPEARRAAGQALLAEQRLDHQIGRALGRKLAERLGDLARREARVERRENEVGWVEEVRDQARLQGLGGDPAGWVPRMLELQAAAGARPTAEYVQRRVESLVRQLEHTTSELKRFAGGGET